MNREQEEAFVYAFIQPDKQERYLQMLANPKRRSKILQQLYHTLDIVPARATTIENRDHSSAWIEQTLRSKGAGPTCYLISTDSDLDQQEMPLREVLDLLLRVDLVAVVCCVPGQLAYYKSEWDGTLLQREPIELQNRKV